MRKVIIALFFICAPLAMPGLAWNFHPIGSGEIVIILNKYPNDPKWEDDERSLTYYPPMATFDGKAIYLYAYETMQDVTLTVTDSQGNVVNSALVTVHPDQPAMLMLDAESGSYRLEITYKGDYYYGEFEIE